MGFIRENKALILRFVFTGANVKERDDCWKIRSSIVNLARMQWLSFWHILWVYYKFHIFDSLNMFKKQVFLINKAVWTVL